MASVAKLKYARISPQKARLVADQIRGLPVDNALNVLTFSNKKAAQIIKKVLDSAIANAEHNDAADVDELIVNLPYRIPIGRLIPKCRQKMKAIRERHFYRDVRFDSGPAG